MPAIVDWDQRSEAFQRLRPFLQGEFACQRCGGESNLWQFQCSFCGGRIQPIPLIPVPTSLSFEANDFFDELWGATRWEPEILRQLGIEALVESFGGSPYVYFRSKQSLEFIDVADMYYCSITDDRLVDAQMSKWGPAAFFGFDQAKINDAYLRGGQVRITLITRVPITPGL